MEKKKLNFKTVLNVALGGVISLFAMYVFVYGIDISVLSFKVKIDPIDFSKMLIILKEVDPLYFILSLIISQIPFINRAFRLKEIIGSSKVSFLDSLHMNIFGFGMNNVLPARTGEFYKSYLIKKKADIGYVSSLGVIFVERLYDGFMMCLFFIISVFLIESRLVEGAAITSILPLLKTLTYIGLGGFVLAIILVLAFRNSKRVVLLPEKVSDFIIKEIKMIDSFLIKKSFISFFVIIVNSIFVWFFLGLGLYLLLVAFNISAGGLVSAFFTEGVIGFSVSVPQAPGYIGVFQIGSSTALGSLGVDTTIAQSMAIILWAIHIIPVTIAFGTLFLLGKRG